LRHSFYLKLLHWILVKQSKNQQHYNWYFNIEHLLSHLGTLDIFTTYYLIFIEVSKNIYVMGVCQWGMKKKKKEWNE